MRSHEQPDNSTALEHLRAIAGGRLSDTELSAVLADAKADFVEGASDAMVFERARATAMELLAELELGTRCDSSSRTPGPATGSSIAHP